MKLACADSTFPFLEHEQSVELVRMLGFEGLALAVMGNSSHIRPEHVRGDLAGWAGRLDERIRGRGLQVADFFFIPWTDFETMAPNHPDARERQHARELFREMLALAAALGADGFTLLPGVHWPHEPWETSLQRAAVELAWRVEEGRRHGLAVSIEPHVGAIVDTPERTLRLLEACPCLRLTVDYTHFVVQGIPVERIEPLTAYARHVHVRAGAPGRLQTTLRESAIDHERLVDTLLEAGYDGYLSLEYGWSPTPVFVGRYELGTTDTLAETILLRDLIRARLERARPDYATAPSG